MIFQLHTKLKITFSGCCGDDRDRYAQVCFENDEHNKQHKFVFDGSLDRLREVFGKVLNALESGRADVFVFGSAPGDLNQAERISLEDERAHPWRWDCGMEDTTCSVCKAAAKYPRLDSSS
jgi:hypothetical protein